VAGHDDEERAKARSEIKDKKMISLRLEVKIIC
jgi:hypothetical protein